MKLAKFTEIISSNIMLKKFMKKIGSYLIALWEVSEALILLCPPPQLSNRPRKFGGNCAKTEIHFPPICRVTEIPNF